MSWATKGKRISMNGETPPTLDASMTEQVEVRVVKAFGLVDRIVEVGTIVSLPRHRAEYARFLQLVEWL